MSEERTKRIIRPLNRFSSCAYNVKFKGDRLRKKDTKLFISLIQVHGCLYDRNDCSFNDTNITNKAWCAIAMEIIPSFLDKKPAQQQGIIKKLKSKWKYLLSCYKKHVSGKKGGSQENNTNLFEYAKVMDFMKLYLHNKLTQNKTKPMKLMSITASHMLPTPDNSGSSEHTTPEPSVLHSEEIFKTSPTSTVSASSFQSLLCVRKHSIESPTPPSPEADPPAEYREIIQPFPQQNFHFANDTSEQANVKFLSFLGEMIDFVHPNHREDLKKELLLIAFDFKKRYSLQTYSSVPAIPSIQHVYSEGNATCEEQRIGLSVRKDLLEMQDIKNV